MHVPDIGIQQGAETVKVNRIGFKIVFTQHRFGVTNAQRQKHLAVFKCQPVKARQQSPKLALQMLGKRE